MNALHTAFETTEHSNMHSYPLLAENTGSMAETCTWPMGLSPADGRSVTLTARGGERAQKWGAWQVNTCAKAPRAMRCHAWYTLLSNKNL